MYRLEIRTIDGRLIRVIRVASISRVLTALWTNGVEARLIEPGLIEVPRLMEPKIRLDEM